MLGALAKLGKTAKTPARALGLALALILVTGCAEREAHEPPPTETIDLLQRLDGAEIRESTALIRPGFSEAKPYLISGWHPKTFKVGDDRAGWTIGDRADVELFLAQTGPAQLTIQCAPVLRPGDSPPKVRIELNGEPIFDQVLAGHWQDYSIELPVDHQRVGENLLSIHHPLDKSPRRLKKDTRVAWRRLEVTGPAKSSGQTKTVADGEALFVPTGQRLDFFLELPRSSRWTADSVVPRGQAGHLKMLWQPLAGEPSSHAFSRTESASWVVNPLAAPAERHAGRLSLWAEGPSGGVFVSRPRIDLRSPDAEPSASDRASTVDTAPVDTAPARPNVIIYMIDTLRADHLGAYGYSRPTSPAIDRFAEQAVLFENARAQSSWTRASVASVLTGLWPTVHGAEDDPDALTPEIETLPEHLKKAGYGTVAVISNGNVSEPFGFNQGYDYFRYLDPDDNGGKIYRAYEVHEHLFQWLDADDDRADGAGEEPLFLYLHTMNPHAPYEAPEPFHSQMSEAGIDPSFGTVEHLISLSFSEDPPPPGTRERLIDLYDAEILANDVAFAELLTGLEQRGLLDNSWIFVVSDHGEEFNDHGDWQHGFTLYDEQLRVPLIVRPPGGFNGRRRPDLVEHVDILPTILEVLDLPQPSVRQGQSFASLLSSGEVSSAGPQRTALAQLKLRGREANSFVDADGRFKTIVERYEGVDAYPQVFDLEKDARELSPRVDPWAPHGAFFEAHIRQRIEAVGRPFDKTIAEDVPQELKDQLEALGYAR